MNANRKRATQGFIFMYPSSPQLNAASTLFQCFEQADARKFCSLVRTHLKLAPCLTRSLLPSQFYVDRSHCQRPHASYLVALPSTRAISQTRVFYVAFSHQLHSVCRLSGQVNQKIVDDFPGLLRLFEPRHVPAFVDKRERRIFD